MAKKERKEKKEIKKNAPLGVKIISILNYISGGIAILAGLLFIALALINYPLIADKIGSSISSVIITVISIFLIIVGLIAYFIAKGMWRGQEWARITQIILSIIFGFSALTSVMKGMWSNIFGLAINFAIAGYLLFNKRAKRFFKQ
ncbi:MAG: hypothetical protein Q8L29_03465 [archaeon]|nr:hypothetical protein [archaeon]